MRTRAIYLLLLMLWTGGCASLPKKFIRKKKVAPHTPSAVYLQDGPTQKKYSNEYYYKTHFTFWKSWHDELIDQLGGNSKKVYRCAQESVNHLMEMNRYLSPAKQAELASPIADLTRITRRLESGNTSPSEQSGFHSELEKIHRIVSNNFYYNKVKDDLAPETVDLGAAPAASPAPVASPAPTAPVV